LTELEPFVSIEKPVQLHHPKLGNKASVRLRFIFTPEIIAKSRKNTSTFSTAGRAMTQIGVTPVVVGKGVVTGVVTGVGMGVGTVGKGVKSIFKKEGSKITIEEPVVLEVPSASVSQPVPVSAVQLGQNGAGSGSAMAFPQRSTSPPVSNYSSITLPGTLRVEVIEGSDLMAADGDPVRPYVVASIGETEHKTKHVSKTNTPLW
jgi:Ca2+-dependent lipid-binding protein